jgi:hypothetical protein
MTPKRRNGDFPIAVGGPEPVAPLNKHGNRIAEVIYLWALRAIS